MYLKAYLGGILKMRFTIEEEKLSTYIYVNGEEDGRKSLGIQEIEYEVSDTLYNECENEFRFNNNISQEKDLNYLQEKQFLKEYGEFLASKGHKVME